MLIYTSHQQRSGSYKRITLNVTLISSLISFDKQLIELDMQIIKIYGYNYSFRSLWTYVYGLVNSKVSNAYRAYYYIIILNGTENNIRVGFAVGKGLIHSDK